MANDSIVMAYTVIVLEDGRRLTEADCPTLASVAAFLTTVAENGYGPGVTLTVVNHAADAAETA